MLLNRHHGRHLGLLVTDACNYTCGQSSRGSHLGTNIYKNPSGLKLTRPTTTTELLSSNWQRFLAFVLNRIWLKFKNNLSIFPWRKWDWRTTKTKVSAKPKQQTPSGSGGLKQVYGTPNNKHFQDWRAIKPKVSGKPKPPTPSTC